MIPAWYHGELELGDTGTDVSHAQVLLGLTPTGTFDEQTAAFVRGVQLREGLPVSGRVTKRTAEKLGDRATTGLVPEWHTREIWLWDIGPDVRRANELLGRELEGDVLTPESEAAVLRLQSANRLPLTGVIDAETAKILGD